jgi:hypothetical protein
VPLFEQRKARRANADGSTLTTSVLSFLLLLCVFFHGE